MNDFEQKLIHDRTRRHFFGQCGVGLGSIALNQMLAADGLANSVDRSFDPMAPQQSHYGAKAKNVIYLFMAGGPSHLELFEDKPKLREYNGKLPPESLVKGKRFAFLGKDAKILGSQRKFQKYGESQMELSELLPHHRKIVDDACWLRGMKTDVFNTDRPSFS